MAEQPLSAQSGSALACFQCGGRHCFPHAHQRRIKELEDVLREIRDRWAYPKLVALINDALGEVHGTS